MTAAEQRWTERLIQAIKSGEPLDLSGIQGDRAWDDSARKWPRNATIPAPALRTALIADQVRADPHGLNLRGARIAGTCDFADVAVGFGVKFIGCRFEETFSAPRSRWPRLDLAFCWIPEVDLAGGSVDFNLVLVGLRTEGEVCALGAHIGGQLALNGARLANPGGDALTLDDAAIGGGLFLRDHFEAQGEVRALGAHVGGQLSFDGAHLANPNRRALCFDGATIDGDAFFGERFAAEGEVRASGAHFGGQLNFDGAHLANPSGVALNLDGATIGDDAFLDGAFTAEGEVRAVGAHIGGQLSLKGAHLANPSGKALHLDHSTINGGAFLADGFTAEGEVRALGAHIGGQLSLKGAHLANPSGKALGLDNATIVGNAYLDRAFEATGEVRALGAHIGGQLSLKGARLSNANNTALGLDRATIIGSAFLDDGFTAEGEVRAVGARFEGQLSFDGAHLANPGATALSLHEACVENLYLSPQSSSGEINLAGAQVATLVVPEDKCSLPGPLIAHGWQVVDVRGFLRTNDVAAAEWLNTLPAEVPFSPAPWIALAGVYGRNGHPAGARRLRFKAARLTTKQAPLASKVLRRLYEVLVGYGYLPALALGWLVAIGLGAWAIIQWQHGSFLADDSTGYVSPLSAPLVGLDTAVPAIGLGALNSWHSTVAWVGWALAALRASAWIMTALLLAGITGLLKKAD